jgi:hypothetical protein
MNVFRTEATPQRFLERSQNAYVDRHGDRVTPLPPNAPAESAPSVPRVSDGPEYEEFLDAATVLSFRWGVPGEEDVYSVLCERAWSGQDKRIH